MVPARQHDGTADEDGRAVAPDTPFILGSASKPFTAVVVGQLVEEGVLSWDDPVWPYLSHLVDAPPEGFKTATVEQLLTHTGGLGMSVGTAGTVKIHDGPDALDRRVDELLSRPLAGTPGEAFEYSNAGPMLLAAVVEQITGRSFAVELRDRVFDPLGMTGSFATADDPPAAAMATGHRQWFGRTGGGVASAVMLAASTPSGPSATKCVDWSQERMNQLAVASWVRSRRAGQRWRHHDHGAGIPPARRTSRRLNCPGSSGCTGRTC